MFIKRCRPITVLFFYILKKRTFDLETVEVFIPWAEVLMTPTSSGYPPLYTLWLRKKTIVLRNIETPYSGALIVKVTRQLTNTVKTLHKIYVTLPCHAFSSFSRFVCMYKLNVSNFEKRRKQHNNFKQIYHRLF